VFKKAPDFGFIREDDVKKKIFQTKVIESEKIYLLILSI